MNSRAPSASHAAAAAAAIDKRAVYDAARRRAAELREQAFDDAFSAIGRWLFGTPPRPAPTPPKAAPCRS